MGIELREESRELRSESQSLDPEEMRSSSGETVRSPWEPKRYPRGQMIQVFPGARQLATVSCAAEGSGE